MKTNETPNAQRLDWPKLLATWNRSALSGAEFGKRHGMAYHLFVYWKRKLGKTGFRSEQLKQSAFIKVKSSPAVTATGGFMITLPGGTLIEDVNESNVSVLRVILEQL